MTASSKTIAIIGLGPKGLYALDALCQAARDVPLQRFEVHILEPSPHFGAGPIYDPDQPDFLVMNFPAQKIDAWTGGRGPGLLRWLKDNGRPVAAGDYVPRAEVGRYLTWCFSEVIAGVPSNIHLKVHSEHVSDLNQFPGGWKLLPNGLEADEVLVTTGHQDWTRKTAPSVASHISSPFPIDERLSRTNVPPGASVACKGFALTFLDTMLAFTEGRGGAFTRTEQGYAYHASGDEPGVIAPFSRTGRPMRAKVEAGQFMPLRDEGFWNTELSEFDELLSTEAEATFQGAVWPALQQIAERTLGCSPGTSAAAFADWQGSVLEADRCRRELRRGYAIAMGFSSPDIYWALAEAWRQCYPRLVRWISHHELARQDAAGFRSVAAEMERLAFGPPAQNVGKLICLDAAGLVSLNHLTGDLFADVTVDATIPPAGSSALSPPLNALLREGHLRVGAMGGIIVDDRAQTQANRTATKGLSVIGRATEGCVLGNDTLSRSLCDLPERWAEHVVREAQAERDIRLERTA